MVKIMSNSEIFTYVSSLIGIAFVFGKQAASINRLHRDVTNLAELHRNTVEELHDIAITLAKIEQKLFGS